MQLSSLLPAQFTLLFSWGWGGGDKVHPVRQSTVELPYYSLRPRVICNVDLKSKTIAQKSGKSNAETPYYGNKVSSWMQLVNSVPWTFGVYFP